MSDSDGRKTVWDNRTWDGLETTSWCIKSVQGQWTEEKREGQRGSRKERGEPGRHPPAL